MPLAAALAVAAGFVLMVWGLSPLFGGLFRAGAVDERILAYGIEGRRTRAEVLEPGFRERMIVPRVERLRQFVGRNTPEAAVAGIQARLALAGSPYGLRAVDFLILRVAAAAAGLVVGLLAGLVTGRLAVALIGGVALGAVLWALPAIWLERQVAAHRRAVLAALPNVIDFLAVSVDAGLTFDAGLARVIERYRNPLTLGLEMAMTEARLGRPRLEALEAYATAAGVDDVRGFLSAVVQGERMGVPVARTLRLQADELRWRRRQDAREKGASASVKMLIPMIVFIMPTIWLILLGPALIQVLRTGL